MPQDILSALAAPPATPTEKLAARAQKIADEVMGAIPQLLAQMVQLRNQVYDKVWNSKEPVQLVVAKMGTAAVSIFGHDAALVAFIIQRLKPALVAAGMAEADADARIASQLPGIPEGYTATPHEDGTVTVTLDAA